MKKSVVLYKKLSAPLMARLHEQAEVTLIEALDDTGLAKLRDEPVSQDNYFHTVLGLLGVRTTVYDPRRDMGVMCQAAG